MKKRIQLTIGPETQKLLTKLARQNNKLSGMNYNSTDVITSACALGLLEMTAKTLPTTKTPASIRD